VNRLLLVGSGGFVGAVLRYAVGGWVQNRSGSGGFPYGTLTVNLVGCAVIGLLSYLAESRGVFSPDAHQFIFIGMLGAFTTFSTFGSETAGLFRKGDDTAALVNVGAHLLLGLAMIWAGRAAGRLLWD
jgi:CrcB protein